MAVATEKYIITHGLLAKAPESSYGAGGALVGTDAILTEERAEVTPIFNTDGERNPASGQGGRFPKVGPGGRHADFQVSVLGRGSNAAYSAILFPDDVHEFLLASGHAVTTDLTASAESQTYDPVTAQDASFHAEAYTRNEKFTLVGGLCSMSFVIDGPTFTRFDFASIAIMDVVPAEGAVPALTIASHQPPKAESLALNIGDFLIPRVKGVRFNQNINLQKRNDVNAASGFAGVGQGFRNPILEIDIEATALVGSPFHTTAGIDPYALWEAATQLPISFDVGSVQYNRWKFIAAQAQLINVTKAEEGEIALWTLEFGLAQTAPGADDDYSLVFD